MRIGRAIGRSIPIILALNPPVWIGVLAWRYSTNIPAIDGWGMYLVPYVNHSLSSFDWGYFWMAMNRGINRKFLPMLVGAVVLNLTHFNLKAIVLLVVLLHFLLAFLMYRIYVHVSGPSAPLLFPALSMALVSLSLWPYWVQPVFLETTLAILGFVGSIFFLTRQSTWKSLFGAAASASAGSLSFFGGNLAWLLSPILLFSGRKLRWPYLAAWLIFGGFFFILFITAYLAAVHPEAVSLARLSIGDMASFVAAFLGSPFTKRVDDGSPIVTGWLLIGFLILLTLLVTRFVEDGWKRAAPWAVIGLWCITNALFASIGRGEDGRIAVEAAYAERYYMYGTLLFAGLVPLSWTLFSRPRSEKVNSPLLSRGLTATGAAVLLALALVFVQTGRISLSDDYLGESTSRNRSSFECVPDYLVVPGSCFGIISPNPQIIRDGIARLYEAGVYPRPVSDLPIGFAIPAEPISDGSFDIVGKEGYFYRQSAGTEVAWTVHLPNLRGGRWRNSPLEGIWLVTGAGTTSGSAGFSIRVALTGVFEGLPKVISETVTTTSWTPITVDLTAYAGSMVEVLFAVQADSAEDYGYWSPPFIRFNPPETAPSSGAAIGIPGPLALAPAAKTGYH